MMIDNELETAIDAIGRDRVFDRARALGWSVAVTPEKWVWWGIVEELRNHDKFGTPLAYPVSRLYHYPPRYVSIGEVLGIGL